MQSFILLNILMEIFRSCFGKFLNFLRYFFEEFRRILAKFHVFTYLKNIRECACRRLIQGEKL